MGKKRPQNTQTINTQNYHVKALKITRKIIPQIEYEKALKIAIKTLKCYP